MVHDRLDLSQPLRRHRTVMGEVETEAIGRDERSGLVHRLSERLPQRRVQQMRRGMIAHGGEAALLVDVELHRPIFLQALDHRIACFIAQSNQVRNQLADAIRIDYFAGTQRLPGVADLAAAFGIEHGLVGGHFDEVAFDARLRETRLRRVGDACNLGTRLE